MYPNLDQQMFEHGPRASPYLRHRSDDLHVGARRPHLRRLLAIPAPAHDPSARLKIGGDADLVHNLAIGPIARALALDLAEIVGATVGLVDVKPAVGARWLKVDTVWSAAVSAAVAVGWAAAAVPPINTRDGIPTWEGGDRMGFPINTRDRSPK
jgi:hypothetical protein